MDFIFVGWKHLVSQTAYWYVKKDENVFFFEMIRTPMGVWKDAQQIKAYKTNVPFYICVFWGVTTSKLSSLKQSHLMFLWEFERNLAGVFLSHVAMTALSKTELVWMMPCWAGQECGTQQGVLTGTPRCDVLSMAASQWLHFLPDGSGIQ